MNDAYNPAGYPDQIPSAAPAEAATRSNAQSAVARQAKSLAGKKQRDKGKKFETRNWCLFFFFRIMREKEMEETDARLRAAMWAWKQARKQTKELEATGVPQDRKVIGFLKDKTPSEFYKEFSKLKLDLAFPSALNGGLVDQARRTYREKKKPGGLAAAKAPSGKGERAKADLLPDRPAEAFRDWLKVLVTKNSDDLKKGATRLARAMCKGGRRQKGLEETFGIPPGPDAIEQVVRQVAIAFRGEDPSVPGRLFGALPAILACIRDHYLETLKSIRGSLERTPDEKSPHGFLARMILYEVIRQGAPIFVDSGIEPVLRSDAAETERLGGNEKIDCTPITMAFSHPGLAALKIHETTLASFPDPFKDGMAARAGRLGDIGRSAPENWEGELGLRSVHGYFTGGSNLDRDDPLGERFWKGLRSEIRLFNDPTVEEGGELRSWIGLLSRLLGVEIVHIELGQDPYRVKKNEVEPIWPRVEHFGFRDGLSQPFVDLGLDAPLSGGGTVDRRGTWSPVAPGEIFLDEKDETGEAHMLPLGPDLRDGSTYLVFRKLEQDVEGFRAFLEQQRPDSKGARQKLAAQFFGRWPSGTSLVHSPHTERSTAGSESEAGLNDFRYAADDPFGRKCPLGAHVRRANPRDMGGRNDVRHHRILRRGIAYGGRLLGDEDADDGEKRGILFVCANARIDLQFEVVQGDWLNGGEFLGQAGLGRCPIAGAQDGSVSARFLEAGAVAPVTGLPSFVTMRGGDYFFAPGIKALTGIAEGCDFKPKDEELPFHGDAMGEAATPSLFGDDRLNRYWTKKLGRGSPVRVEGGFMELPPGIPGQENVAFVGRYDQVAKVLSNRLCKDAEGKMRVPFSVEPYLTAGRRITRGEEFLVGTDTGDERRVRLFAILDEAWNMVEPHWEKEGSPRVRAVAKERLDAALRRTAGARRIDLVEDLAAQATYGVLDKVFGVRGPPWLSELAGAFRFSRQHIGDLPPDWIAAFKGERPADPGLKTMQIWSTFLVADLIGNYWSQQSLQALARQAGTEMLNHIDYTLAQIRARGARPELTLIEAFVANEASAIRKYYLKGETPTGAEGRLYYKDVAIILLEILGSTLAVVPLTFASVMNTLLTNRFDLSLQLQRLKPGGVAQIIYEGERLSPNSAIRFRRCMFTNDLGGSVHPRTIEKGDFVAAVIGKANRDRHVFPQPERFSLGCFDPLSDTLKDDKGVAQACARDPKKYLLFGVTGSNKDCWGRDRVAMPILEECIYACGRLQGLRPVAGLQGAPQKIGSVTIGRPARFSRILSKDARGT